MREGKGGFKRVKWEREMKRRGASGEVVVKERGWLWEVIKKRRLHHNHFL